MHFRHFFLFLLISSNLFAQDNNKNYHLGASAHYGFIARHRDSMNDLIEDPIKAINITLGRQMFGQQAWEQTFLYPAYGMGFYAADLGNQDNLGYGYALYGFMTLPLWESEKIKWHYQFELGLVYVTEGNIAVGSHTNVFIGATLGMQYALTERLWLVNELSGNHFSNGATKMPNLGLNPLTYRLGINYRLNREANERVVHETATDYATDDFAVVYNAGIKEIKPAGGDKYFISSIMLDYTHALTAKHRIGFGLDWIYDSSFFTRFEREGVLDLSQAAIMQYALHLSYRFDVHRFSVIAQQGFHLYSKWTDDGSSFQRAGLRYRISKRTLLNLTIMSKGGVAYFTEWGVGLRF